MLPEAGERVVLPPELWVGLRAAPSGLAEEAPAIPLPSIWPNAAVRTELAQLLAELDERSSVVPQPSGLKPEVPLLVHATYTRDEILAAYAVGSPARPPQLREGVKQVREANTDLFFVTLRKSEREYSPTTRYRDYAISRTLFHWESQATQSARSPSVRRNVEHGSRGGTIMLFVRESKQTTAGVTAPYYCLGPADYVDSRGDRPVAFTWRLREAMPEQLFELARSVAAA